MGTPIGVFVAWPYANGKLHLGHIAGAYLPADIFARFHRLRGNDVLMVSGSDAHGTPITLKAREENCSPMEVVERYHETFLEGWKNLGITFDLFTHTHTPNHRQVTQDFFSQLLENGDLEVQTQKQFFDREAKLFLPDRYVRGTCPKCSYDNARGDQCEQCGATFDTAQLQDPISLISKSTPALRDTDHYYFKMGNYSEKLNSWVATQEHWRPHVKNYTIGAIKEGLPSRAITRDIDWGVSVPVEGWESKVIYVWFDAVIGYFSASVEWASLSKSRDWENWWKNEDARGYYFIGKDNVPFHSVIWPIELMGYGHGLNLPYDVPANQFLNIDGEKFSTSRGLAVWLDDVLEHFDADAVRYYITSIFPETKDSNFTWKGFVQRNNGELAAAWGNLVSRVLGFAVGRYDGVVPQPLDLEERDKRLLARIETGFQNATAAYEAVELREALRESMDAVREVNRYLDDKAPWHEFKTDPAKTGTTMYVALKAIDSLKTMLAPVLPFSSQKVHEYLGYQGELFGQGQTQRRQVDSESYEILTYEPCPAESAHESRWQLSELLPGQKLTKPKPLFAMLDENEILSQSGEA